MGYLYLGILAVFLVALIVVAKVMDEDGEDDTISS